MKTPNRTLHLSLSCAASLLALSLSACGGSAPAPESSADVSAPDDTPAATPPTAGDVSPRAAAAAKRVEKAKGQSPHQQARIALVGLAMSPEFKIPADVTEALSSLQEWTLDLMSAKTTMTNGLLIDTLLPPLATVCGVPNLSMMELLTSSGSPDMGEIKAQCKVDMAARWSSLDELVPEFVLLSIALEKLLELEAPLTDAERTLVRSVAELHRAGEDHDQE
ncbi:MAG: hypothetical protein KF915_20210 [Polyangiaceae bacterium]|nr:hypothetical protein [Polyangiaceae bacterium]